MLLSLLIYVGVGLINVICFFLPTWSPIPATFAAWMTTMFAYLYGIDWLIPIDQLVLALTVSLAIDGILLAFWVIRWVIAFIPFFNRH